MRHRDLSTVDTEEVQTKIVLSKWNESVPRSVIVIQEHNSSYNDDSRKKFRVYHDKVFTEDNTDTIYQGYITTDNGSFSKVQTKIVMFFEDYINSDNDCNWDLVIEKDEFDIIPNDIFKNYENVVSTFE